MTCLIAYKRNALAGLWRAPYPEVICNVLQTSLQYLTRTHNELDIVYCGEPRPQYVKERLFCCW